MGKTLEHIKDCLEQDIQVGDIVAYAAGYGSSHSLHFGLVLGEQEYGPRYAYGRFKKWGLKVHPFWASGDLAAKPARLEALDKIMRLNPGKYPNPLFNKVIAKLFEKYSEQLGGDSH